MSRRRYSREAVESVLLTGALPQILRIFPRRYLTTPLGIAPADSRFTTKRAGHGVLYAAADFTTALVETLVRDRPARKREILIPLREVTEAAWATIESRSDAEVSLVDLRKDGCVRLGARTDSVRARNHGAGRALGRAIHEDHGATDGFLFASRLTGGDAFALFGRALDKVQVSATGLVAHHPELPGLLDRYGIRLLVDG